MKNFKKNLSTCKTSVESIRQFILVKLARINFKNQFNLKNAHKNKRKLFLKLVDSQEFSFYDHEEVICRICRDLTSSQLVKDVLKNNLDKLIDTSNGIVCRVDSTRFTGRGQKGVDVTVFFKVIPS